MVTLEFELLTPEEAAKAVQDDVFLGAPKSSQDESRVRFERKQQTARKIPDAQGRQWLMALPAEARPVYTALRHAHIIDKMARVWQDDDQVALYFVDLLVDRRGNRKGFSFEVLGELIALKDYWQSQHPDVDLSSKISQAQPGWSF